MPQQHTRPAGGRRAHQNNTTMLTPSRSLFYLHLLFCNCQIIFCSVLTSHFAFSFTTAQPAWCDRRARPARHCSACRHRRLLEDVRRARSARPEGQKSRPWAGSPLRQIMARAAGGGKPAGGRRRFDESVRRNKYVPTPWTAHQLARTTRVS